MFVDGVGLGPDDPATNPLAGPAGASLAGLAGARPVVAAAHAGGNAGLLALDACLGVPGLPQSATGQAALLTGVNVPARLGRHVGPYPGADVLPFLSDTIWQDAAAPAGATLANAYPERYLVRAGVGRGRMGAIARSAVLAGIELRGADALRAGEGVSAFLTNDGWREVLGVHDLPHRTPADAGRVMASLALRHRLTLFEYYATDIAGHRQDRAAAERAVADIGAAARAAREALPANAVLVVVSDHGNVEDLSTGRHTLNPALCIWSGPPAPIPLGALTDLRSALALALADSPTVSPRTPPRRMSRDRGPRR